MARNHGKNSNKIRRPETAVTAAEGLANWRTARESERHTADRLYDLDIALLTRGPFPNTTGTYASQRTAAPTSSGVLAGLLAQHTAHDAAVERAARVPFDQLATRAARFGYELGMLWSVLRKESVARLVIDLETGDRMPMTDLSFAEREAEQLRVFQELLASEIEAEGPAASDPNPVPGVPS